MDFARLPGHGMPRWMHRFFFLESMDASLHTLGFSKSKLEHAVYRKGDDKSFLLVGVYVDDLIITGTNPHDIENFKSEMQKLFKMSDLGLLSYYLGIEMEQKNDEIRLCQSSYAKNILENAGLSSCNVCATPMECQLKIRKKDDSGTTDATLYQSIIGCLRYLVNTRPDIGYAVGIASRYMEAPTKDHWGLTKQILRYVQGTIRYGCCYK
jgi:hypothetical protein